MERHGLDEPKLCALAEELGRRLRGGDVLLLHGPMGAGKTTFTRALARGLGVDRPERVRSPTFNLCLRHAGPRPLLHVDLFRLMDAQAEDASGPVGEAAFEALGLDALDESSDPDAVLVVEWADLWQAPPADHLRIVFSIEGDRRGLVIEATGPRHAPRTAVRTGDEGS